MALGIRRLPLRDEIYERVKGLILNNKLRPNQEIAIDRLAQDLGVSPTPVREALAKLELDGLILAARHRPPRVTEILPGHVEEIYEVRILMEGWAAGVAARTLAEQDLDRMTDVLNSVEKHAGHSSPDFLVSRDIEFHGLILRSVKNQLFSLLARLMTVHSVRIRSLVEHESADYIRQTTREHRAILGALRARDPVRSRKEMVTHLRRASARTQQVLSTGRAAVSRRGRAKPRGTLLGH